MKALISPNEPFYNYEGSVLGCRVAQIAHESFDIALPLFWVDCADSVIPDFFYYSESGNIEELPEYVAPPLPPMNNSEPTVI